MGLARFFHDEEDNLTRMNDENVLGTADYLAPEQAVDSHDVDIRADIYSLGCTFYFLLSGKAPYADRSITEKLVCHQTQSPQAIRSKRPDVPPEMASVLDKMMDRTPATRYQQPAEVVAGLQPWAKSLPGAGASFVGATRKHREREERRRLWLTIGSAGALVVGLALFFTLLLGR